ILAIAAFTESSDPTSSSNARMSTLFFRENASTSATCVALRPFVSRMLAKTVCPASARALHAIRPKPLDDPVTTMTFFTASSFSPPATVGTWVRDLESCETTVGPDHLRVHPPAVGAGQIGDGTGDVLGLANAFEGRHPGQLVDEGRRLPREEQLRSRG